MANEPNTPDHRWYERRNNIALSNEDLSRETIFDSGIQKINSWINSQPWGFDYPQLVLDFDDEYYRVDGGDTTFASAITHTRASTATYVDSTGTLQTAAINEPRLGHHVWNGTAWVNEGLLHESEARTNLLLNSGALAPQSVIVSAVAHTIHFTGTGTITLSGASTAGPLVGTGTGEGNRVSLTFTPIAAALIITVTGTVTNAQLEAAPTPSSYIPTAGSTVTRAADVLTVPAANLPYPEPVVIGPELTPDPSFDDPTATNDQNVAGYDVVGGELVVVSAPAFHAGVGQVFTQPLVVGKVYEVSYTITEYTSGSIRGQLAGGVSINLTTRSAAGTYKQIIVPSSSHTFFGFQSTVAGTTLKIDNISVREINPLALSIQMDGRVTYADTGLDEAVFLSWTLDSNNYILNYLQTNSTNTGRIRFSQNSAGVFDTVATSGTYLSPDILVPINMASRHGSTFINGATDGVGLTADTTPTALPNLSATNLSLGTKYNGTIRTFRMWAQDIGDAGLVEATS